MGIGDMLAQGLHLNIREFTVIRATPTTARYANLMCHVCQS